MSRIDKKLRLLSLNELWSYVTVVSIYFTDILRLYFDTESNSIIGGLILIKQKVLTFSKGYDK